MQHTTETVMYSTPEEDTLSPLANGSRGKAGLSRLELPVREPDERQQMIEGHLRERLASALKCSVASLDPGKPLYSLGVDSLVAIELKSHIEERFGVVLPMEIFLENISIAQLATRLHERIAAGYFHGSFGAEFPLPAADNNWETIEV